MPFSLVPVAHPHPLAEDGLSICVARPQTDEALVKTMRDLRAIIALGDTQTIILVKRQDIHRIFMDDVERESEQEGEPTIDEAFTRWSRLGSSHISNAMPHIHAHLNCHTAPEPTECPTAFFRRRSVIEAARAMSIETAYAIEIRRALQRALYHVDAEEKPEDFFYALHDIPPPRKGMLPLLECVRDMQIRVRDAGGLYEVPLGEDGYGLVLIPATAVHGRSMTGQLVRSEKSAWRYFT